jgi:hypothetical protein
MREYHLHSEIMLATKDRDTITEVAREYGAAKIVLFGSSLAEDCEPNDIDLGVAESSRDSSSGSMVN